MLNSFSLNWIDSLFNLFYLKEDSIGAGVRDLSRTRQQILAPNSKQKCQDKDTNRVNSEPALQTKIIKSPLTVGVFYHHRDVKVVLDDLTHAGFSLKSLTLMARNCQRYNWHSGLNFISYFERGIFSFSQDCELFFQKFFRRGKYILVVEGTEDMINFAGKVISRRRNHAKVWYMNLPQMSE